MLLGTLIKHAMRAQGPFAEEIDARDPQFGEAVRAEAERAGLSPADYIADTLRRFLAAEDSESWTTIMGAIQRSDDPGAAFIETVLRARLNHRCSQH